MFSYLYTYTYTPVSYRLNILRSLLISTLPQANTSHQGEINLCAMKPWWGRHFHTYIYKHTYFS